MDLREMGYDDRDWINFAQDRDQWRAYVKAAMNLRVPQKPVTNTDVSFTTLYLLLAGILCTAESDLCTYARNLWPPRSPDLTTPDNICYRVRPVYVIDVYKLTPSNGPKERSRRARDLTVALDNLSAIEFRPGDFFFNVEPVIRNEATHRKIVFRVGILA
ncbi:hypothetical protein ANN_21971 [Periplaneta americana]|uniref:Uncharacterized protein n=1 Tax=Periplaneta americana TaxID=6978 RepID=A0ABQ8S775_PERAM|nr:hypothetical protein ANN_21971 [Periplaneta americana]